MLDLAQEGRNVKRQQWSVEGALCSRMCSLGGHVLILRSWVIYAFADDDMHGAPRTPSGAPSVQSHADVLHLCVVRQGLQAFCAPEAALLIAAEGGGHTTPERVVDVDLPGFEARGQTMSLVDIAGSDTRHQLIRGGGGELQGFFRLTEGEDRQDQAKDLLLCDVHGTLHGIEEHRTDEKPAR